MILQIARFVTLPLWILASMAIAHSVAAHPHVFISGGVDFRFDAEERLAALEVSWTYDAFETLYLLAENGMDLNDKGALAEADRRALVLMLGNWPDDFDGSVHVTIEDADIALEWPRDLKVQVIEGRLQMHFVRPLPEPINLSGKTIRVAMFESTYFFDFTLANPSQLFGPAPNCLTEVIAYEPDTGDRDLREMLAKLGRDETSDIPNAGSLFADKVVVTCQ